MSARIVQLIPAESGWVAWLGLKKAALRPQSLIAWALTDDNGTRSVEGLVLEDGKVYLVSELGDRVVLYTPPGGTEEGKAHA